MLSTMENLYRVSLQSPPEAPVQKVFLPWKHRIHNLCIQNMQFLSLANDFFGALQEAIETATQKDQESRPFVQFLILLGPSLSTPKESYLLHLPVLSSDKKESVIASADQDSLIRLHLRRLMAQFNSLSLKSLGATRCHLLIQAPRTLSIPQSLPKQRFKLKKGQSLVEIDLSVLESVIPRSDKSTVEADEEDDLIWYQLNTVLPGFQL